MRIGICSALVYATVRSRTAGLWKRSPYLIHPPTQKFQRPVSHHDLCDWQGLVSCQRAALALVRQQATLSHEMLGPERRKMMKFLKMNRIPPGSRSHVQLGIYGVFSNIGVVEEG